jgi:hypothetical protein
LPLLAVLTSGAAERPSTVVTLWTTANPQAFEALVPQFLPAMPTLTVQLL